MPQPPLEDDNDTIIRTVLFVYVALYAFMINLSLEAFFVGNERSIGIDVLMSMNGVSKCQNAFSWLLSGSIFSVLYITPIALVLTMYPFSTMEAYFVNSNFFLVWLFLFVHIAHGIAFVSFIASLFSRST